MRPCGAEVDGRGSWNSFHEDVQEEHCYRMSLCNKFLQEDTSWLVHLSLSQDLILVSRGFLVPGFFFSSSID